MPDLPVWYCCLNPVERSVLRSTAEALLLTLFIGVPKDLWDAFWFGTTGTGEARRAAFISIYLLEIVTIIDVETEDEVVVVRPIDFVFWEEASLFVFLPAAACGDGCAYAHYN